MNERASNPIDYTSLPPVDMIFGVTEAMAVAREKLERVSRTTIPVLLQGESGTGKEIIAKLLHARSDRSESPFVKLNCAAIPPTLIESELFGYERGGFTGANATKRGRVEMAHRGTLFLDEVSSVDLAAQAKLLQLLHDGTFSRIGGANSRNVDARLICAANEDLRTQIDEGRFRADLYFRINAVTIILPPLRQRVADLPALADYFLHLYATAYGKRPGRLSREVLRLMEAYHWPGNIRQLENLIRSYVLIEDEKSLAVELAPASLSAELAEIDLARPVSLKKITRAATQEIERRVILRVLEANGWSRRKTARWLGMSYRSLLYKLQELKVKEHSSSRRLSAISGKHAAAVSKREPQEGARL